MSRRRWFGTDGIRGTANVDPVTPELALRLGAALGASLPPAHADVRPRVVVGRDTRLSGRMLECAIAAGITSAGADVVFAGILPTPAVAMLTRTLGAAAGVVVSASHNPFADNGIKLFDGAGFKLADEAEALLERSMEEMTDSSPARPTGTSVGRVDDLVDGGERYLAHLRAAVADTLHLAGRRIVVDAAHGAAFRVAAQLFTDLGADVRALGARPDGSNINVDCGALYPEEAAAEVRASGAELGVVLDGDADRLLLIDEAGVPLDGDEYLAIVARYRPDLAGKTVVGTVMSNVGLELSLREAGVELVRAAVGDRYVLDELRRTGSRLGGEPSGHILFLDSGTTGDGLLAALRILPILESTGRRLSELRRVMTRVPQVLVNVRVARRGDLDDVAPVAAAIEDARRLLDGRGRVLVRFSGTEPLVRIMVEAPDADEARAQAERIAAVVCDELGD